MKHGGVKDGTQPPAVIKGSSSSCGLACPVCAARATRSASTINPRGHIGVSLHYRLGVVDRGNLRCDGPSVKTIKGGAAGGCGYLARLTEENSWAERDSLQRESRRHCRDGRCDECARAVR